MEEFIKKEEKTYVIQADSEGNETLESNKVIVNIESVDTPKASEQTEHESPKQIEVVTGNGKDLDISDVSEYLEVEKPKEEGKKENIIIPEEKK